jgi:hypothetical protein
MTGSAGSQHNSNLQFKIYLLPSPCGRGWGRGKYRYNNNLTPIAQTDIGKIDPILCEANDFCS